MAKHRSSHEINEFRKTAKKLTAERTAYAQAEIAKRARMEKALAGERPHLQAGLQQMPIAVVLAEVPGEILFSGKRPVNDSSGIRSGTRKAKRDMPKGNFSIPTAALYPPNNTPASICYRKRGCRGQRDGD